MDDPRTADTVPGHTLGDRDTSTETAVTTPEPEFATDDIETSEERDNSDAGRLHRDFSEGRMPVHEALAAVIALQAGEPVAQYQTERDNANA